MVGGRRGVVGNAKGVLAPVDAFKVAHRNSICREKIKPTLVGTEQIYDVFPTRKRKDCVTLNNTDENLVLLFSVGYNSSTVHDGRLGTTSPAFQGVLKLLTSNQFGKTHLSKIIFILESFKIDKLFNNLFFIFM